MSFVMAQKDERRFVDPHFGAVPLKEGGAFPSVTLVIPVGGSDLEMTKATIDSLFRVTAYPNWSMAIIDDASTGGIHEFLETVPNRVLITNEKRRSFAANTNAGFRAVKSDYYILFNNDVLVQEPYWLHKMVAAAEADPRVAVVGGGINSCGSFWWINSRGAAEPYHYFHRKFLNPRPFDCMSVGGFNMMVKASVMADIGVLDEGFRPVYGEETDLCIRARFHGYRVLDCFVKVLHVSKGGFRETLGKKKIGAVLPASARRLGIRWGNVLPRAPFATYARAVEHLDHMPELRRKGVPVLQDIPPTTDDGVANPVYDQFPERFAEVPRAARCGESIAILAGRAIKVFRTLISSGGKMI